jgi:hypothetical protein
MYSQYPKERHRNRDLNCGVWMYCCEVRKTLNQLGNQRNRKQAKKTLNFSRSMRAQSTSQTQSAKQADQLTRPCQPATSKQHLPTACGVFALISSRPARTNSSPSSQVQNQIDLSSKRSKPESTIVQLVHS